MSRIVSQRDYRSDTFRARKPRFFSRGRSLAKTARAAHAPTITSPNFRGGTIRHEHIASSLESTVREWPGVEVMPHRFGGLEFRVDRREIGHVHVNGMVDVPFPVRMRRDLVAAGRAEAHHMLPHTGWVTFRVRTEHDVPAAAQLLRLNYERLRGAHARSAIVPILGQPRFVASRDSGDLPA